MSTPEPANPLVEDSPAFDDSPPPRRLPDELILMIVDWCDKLLKDRHKTLAALVLLGKRYKDEVERRLYSRVVLEDKQKAVYTSAGATRDALIRRPSLRQLVRAVRIVWVADAYPDDRVLQVLGDLPAVEDLVCDWNTGKAAMVFLSNPLVRLRRFQIDEHGAAVLAILHDHPTAFSTVDTLVLDSWQLPDRSLDTLCGVTSLGIAYLWNEYDLAKFTSPFAASLTRLVLPLASALAKSEPSTYPSLQRLSISSDQVDMDSFRRAVPAAIAFVAAAAGSACLVSFEWRCTVVPRREQTNRGCINMPMGRWPENAKEILAAIPRQIRHLSLVTNSFKVPDVVAYLLDDSQRPAQLATLPIGGALGRELGAILHGDVVDEVEGAEGPCGALAGVLERAGVEVTTVE